MLRRMGAWDVTAFGNDDAADWALDLLETKKPAEFLENTFTLAKGNGYLEAFDGGQIVAAAAVVATACGSAPQGLPEDLGEWLRGKEAAFQYLAPTALAALQRVRGEESELRELWQETDDFSAWCSDLDAISATLR
ncbi:MAG TPA: DUF4259 domain-containing protein [Candidatus Acidoferrales bacterium]|nr:DUF4259 domain-containing protein [Candidatus Acidoferrales bacterium]